MLLRGHDASFLIPYLYQWMKEHLATFCAGLITVFAYFEFWRHRLPLKLGLVSILRTGCEYALGPLLKRFFTNFWSILLCWTLLLIRVFVTLLLFARLRSLIRKVMNIRALIQRLS